DVANEYVQMICTPEATRHVVDRAIRIARAERVVTCVIVPNDIQEMEAVETPPHAHGTIHSSAGYYPPRIVPTDSELERAADILNAGERVAMLIGAGALRAANEVIEVADILGAGIAKALLGKAALPDDLPYVTGSIGLLGTEPSWNMMNQCDTLLMVGSSFPYSEFLPKEGQARGVQIDIDARMLGIRYPMEVNLEGDSKETLQALVPLLQRKPDRSWRQEIEAGVADWWEVLEAQAMNGGTPLNPQRVFRELSPRLPDGCIITSDSGSSANWFARDLKIRPGMMASLSGNLATMCPGVPYAIAAKFAFPSRPVVAAVGDGAMQMLGNNGLVTISRYWREWNDPRLIILVLNNGDLNQVTWEMRVLTGNPKYETSQFVPDFPYAGFAESLGLMGIKVKEPEQIGPAWEKALAADRPVVYEAITDPEVPTLPPHITFKQATNFMKSMIKGDPNRGRMMKGSIQQAWESLVH
ncbi:MAG TPA: thiamine pyrophosphate-requiring protein, partial [Lacipirellulaceae bacterium]|nr:thiamine pyrophosphate-requiring protein [Lacipirellulaceae bacterium]